MATEHATVTVNGPREDIIRIAQQLAWLSTVFRLPIEGELSRSDFTLHATAVPTSFNLRQRRLKKVEQNGNANTCWHPLFSTGILAIGFPIPVRNGEAGVELPFEAMIQLAGVIGPVEYQGGVVLKGFSTMIFPVLTSSSPPNSSHNATQWHLVHLENDDFIMLSDLASFEDRALVPLKDFDLLVHSRSFLGCYKEVNVNLGTETVAYDRLTTSDVTVPRRRPELSGFSLGLALPKFGGPSATVNFALPKRLSVRRPEDSYEQILSYSSSMPIILYDTSDRRAWMVPTIGVILHMIHVWACLQKSQFPALSLSNVPYTTGGHDIGREAQEVVYNNSHLELYVSKDNNEPYLLKDLVKKYWLGLEMVIAARQDHKFAGKGNLIGWDMMEVINRDPFSGLKTPSMKGFKGTWEELARDPNMVVLFCQGLGDVIIPNPQAQRLCDKWRLVPQDKDYLTATTCCVVQCSHRFYGHTIFWEQTKDAAPFADCDHDKHRRHVQRLAKRRGSSLVTNELEWKGAFVFGLRD